MEPIDDIEALPYSFGAEEVCEFGEEDSSVKGASVVVALRKGVQPLVKAVTAQVVPARQPLGDFEFGAFCSIAQVVIWVGADWAVALVLGDVWNVNVGAAHDEVQGRRFRYRKVRMFIVTRDVPWAGSTLRRRLLKVLPTSIDVEESGESRCIRVVLG